MLPIHGAVHPDMAHQIDCRPEIDNSDVHGLGRSRVALASAAAMTCLAVLRLIMTSSYLTAALGKLPVWIDDEFACGHLHRKFL